MIKNKNMVSFVVSLAVLLAAITGGGTPALAQEQPISVTLSPSEGGTVMLGGPLVLNYKLTNSASASISSVPLGAGGEGWVRFELRDEANQVVAQDARGGTAKDVPLMAAIELKVGESHEGTLVASKWVVPPKIGQYTLHAKVRLPYELETATQRQTLVTAVMIPLTVTAFDPVRLRQMAENLRVTALGTGVTRSRLAMDALFSMTESVALPVWYALVSDPKLNVDRAGYVVAHLKRLGTRAAVDLLANMWGGRTKAKRHMGARGALEELYKHGDPALRTYIGNIFLNRGEDRPKLPHPDDPISTDVD